MNNIQRQQIRSLMEDDKFDALLAYYQEYIDKTREQNVIGDTEFETLKMVFQKEFKIQGIQDFFNNLESEL